MNVRLRVVLTVTALGLMLSATGDSLQPATAGQVKRAVAARKGKVVIVNYWATWCKPCVKEFPALVRVANSLRPRGLELITVSVDAPNRKTQAAAFLRAQKTPGTMLIQDGKNQEAFINGIDPKWRGDVPRTYLYDRAGKLARVLEGEQTEQALRAALAPLLK